MPISFLIITEEVFVERLLGLSTVLGIGAPEKKKVRRGPLLLKDEINLHEKDISHSKIMDRSM